MDRKRELAFLEGMYRKPGSQLVVIYGRRRIGKTDLVLKFLENKRAIYFLADEEPEHVQISRFARISSEVLGEALLGIGHYSTWGEFFEALANVCSRLSEKLVIVIDEVPYLVSTSKGFLSALQRVWDSYLSKMNVMLVLIGSSVSVMETEVLGYKSPIYGRRAGQWRVDYIPFPYLREFLPGYSVVDLARVWGVAGGVPYYLKLFDHTKDFWSNVAELCLSKGGVLYEEAEFLLREELREPRNYKAILTAIARGCTKLGEICNYTGLDRYLVSKYLDTLEMLSIVKRIVPLTASPRTKRGRYLIVDPYFNFWFRYIQPNKGLVEGGRTGELLEMVKEDYPRYMGFVFENLVERRLLCLLPVKRIGKEWGRDYEVDVAAVLTDNRLLLLEVKWSRLDRRSAWRIVSRLKSVSARISAPMDRVYGLAGIEVEGKEELREKGYVVLELADLAEQIREKTESMRRKEQGYEN